MVRTSTSPSSSQLHANLWQANILLRGPLPRRSGTSWIRKGLLPLHLLIPMLRLELRTGSVPRRFYQRGFVISDPRPLGAPLGHSSPQSRAIREGKTIPTKTCFPKAYCCQKQLAFDTCYGLTMIFVKAAVLVEFAHIFIPSGRNLFLWASYAVPFLNGLLFVAYIMARWLACTPQHKLWRPRETGRCFDRKKMEETVSVLDMIFNLIILLLPQMIIWKPHPMQRHKLGISLLFSAGLL